MPVLWTDLVIGLVNLEIDSNVGQEWMPRLNEVLRLTERFEALTRLHYDARKHRFNEQAYGITQNLSNTWLISYTVSLYSGRRRESGFGLNVQIDTVRF